MKSIKVGTAIGGIVVFAICTMVLMIVASATLFYVNEQLSTEQAASVSLEHQMGEIERDLLQARRSEKDFLLRADLKYVARHQAVMTRIDALMARAEPASQALDVAGAHEQFETLARGIHTYQAAFTELASARTTLGLDPSSGLEGELRSAVHAVEEALKSVDNPPLQVKMLMMRRHEKDFIMRRDPKYLDRLNARVVEFLDLARLTLPTPGQRNQITALLRTYQDTFARYVEETLREQELRSAVSSRFSAVEPVFDAVKGLIHGRMEAIHDRAAQTHNTLFATAGIALLVLIAFFTVVGIKLAMSISRPLQKLTSAIGRLADGHLDIEITASRIAEVASISSALEIFRDNAVERDALGRQAEEAEQAAQQAREQALRQEAALETERATQEKQQAETDRQRLESERQRLEGERATEQRVTAEVAAVVAAYARGDFSKRLDAVEKEGVLGALCEGMNRIGEATEASLADVRHVLDALSAGDLSKRMPDHHEGIFDEIGTTLNETSEIITGIVEQIADSGRTIDGSSQEISSAAEDIARKAQQTAASLEQTAAAIEELTASVKSTSDGAIEVRTNVTTTEQEARSCSRIAQDTVTAMEGIERSSTEIGQITKVIDDIAFQTNLLALNAGVEAARAGDAGRGFAIVASEVRALAQRSSDAASEINKLISASATQVKSGVEQVGNSSKALEKILTAVESVAVEITTIADATTQQSSAISEISTSVSHIDRATRENVERFEETTAASMSLRQEALVLAGEVEKFHTGGPARSETRQGKAAA